MAFSSAQNMVGKGDRAISQITLVMLNAKVVEAQILSTFAFLWLWLWIKQQQVSSIGREATQNLQVFFSLAAATKAVHHEALHLRELADNAPGMQALIVSGGRLAG